MINIYYNDNGYLKNTINTPSSNPLNALSYGTDNKLYVKDLLPDLKRIDFTLKCNGFRGIRLTAPQQGGTTSIWRKAILNYYDGDETILQNNNLVAPVTGIYAYSFLMDALNGSVGSADCFVVCKNYDGSSPDQLKAINGNTSLAGYRPSSVSGIIYLEKNDYLSLFYYTNKVHRNLSGSGLEFFLISDLETKEFINENIIGSLNNNLIYEKTWITSLPENITSTEKHIYFNDITIENLDKIIDISGSIKLNSGNINPLTYVSNSGTNIFPWYSTSNPNCFALRAKGAVNKGNDMIVTLKYTKLINYD